MVSDVGEDVLGSSKGQRREASIGRGRSRGSLERNAIARGSRLGRGRGRGRGRGGGRGHGVGDGRGSRGRGGSIQLRVQQLQEPQEVVWLHHFLEENPRSSVQILTWFLKFISFHGSENFALPYMAPYYPYGQEVDIDLHTSSTIAA